VTAACGRRRPRRPCWVLIDPSAATTPCRPAIHGPPTNDDRSVVATMATLALAFPASAAPVKECGNYDRFKGEFTYKQIQGAAVFTITSRVISPALPVAASRPPLLLFQRKRWRCALHAVPYGRVGGPKDRQPPLLSCLSVHDPHRAPAGSGRINRNRRAAVPGRAHRTAKTTFQSLSNRTTGIVCSRPSARTRALATAVICSVSSKGSRKLTSLTETSPGTVASS
jgi:hypothetical protein